jgi:hypothetical protein
MKSLISLNDYQWQYPNTARIPTLTQSGLVGGLLERHQRRVARRARRRAILHRIVGLPLDVLAWLWRGATGALTSASAPSRA